MIRFIAKTCARLMLFIASSLLLAGCTAVAVASFMLTWPLLWGMPTSRKRMTAGVEFVSAGMRLASMFQNPEAFMDAVKSLDDDT